MHSVRTATAVKDSIGVPTKFIDEEIELSKFAEAFLAWIKTVVPNEPLTVAVDATTSCQGIGEDGQPVQLLTVLVHNLKLVLGQWSVHGEKTNARLSGVPDRAPRGPRCHR